MNQKRFPTLSQMTAISALVTAAAPTVVNWATNNHWHIPALAYVALVGIGVNCRSLNSTNSGLDQAEAEAAAQIPTRYLPLIAAISTLLRKGVNTLNINDVNAQSVALVQNATDAKARADAAAQPVDLTTVSNNLTQTAAILATIAPAPVVIAQQAVADDTQQDTPAELAAEQPVQ